MTISNQSVFTVAVLSVALGITTALLHGSATAQSIGTIRADENFNNPNEQDTFGGFGDTGFNAFDLIHNAQLGTVDIDQFNEGQSQRLDDAASEFRRLQLERLRNPQLAYPENQYPENQPTTSGVNESYR
ncbi:MAG: hypothetical protein F6J98_49125 [Moorea sp. SIO4G2]|nr:hypothetical protein [Moorena sp. SIO4G2]